jgi:hypothetical protein
MIADLHLTVMVSAFPHASQSNVRVSFSGPIGITSVRRIGVPHLKQSRFAGGVRSDVFLN